MGLRERKQQQTRERVIETANRLFKEHGYDDTTVEMIAAEAQISPRTFYRYFESKDAVLASSGHRLVEAAARGLPAQSSLETVLSALVDAFESGMAADDYEVVIPLLREHPELASRVAVWRRHWAEELAKHLATADGHDKPLLSQRIRSTVALDVLALALDDWLYRRPDRPVGELTQEALGVLRDALD